MVQLSNPSTTLNGQWTKVGDTTAHACLDEGFAGGNPDDDTTYVWTATANLVCVGNSDFAKKPIAGGPIKFRFRYRTFRPGFSGANFVAQMGSSADGIVAQINMSVNNTGYLTTVVTLTAGERAALTDYANLAWRIVWLSGTAVETRVTAHQIEMPDPAGGANRWWSGWRHG